MYRTVSKDVALVATNGEIIFDQSDEAIDKVWPQLRNNQFDIISLDGVDGSPALPTTGDYVTLVETSPNGGFKNVTAGGSIAAEKTGGTAQAANINLSGAHTGNINRLKITATGIDVAVAFRVIIRQND